MLVEVHDIMNIEGNGQFSVELQAGRFFARTSQGEARKTKVEIQVLCPHSSHIAPALGCWRQESDVCKLRYHRLSRGERT